MKEIIVDRKQMLKLKRIVKDIKTGFIIFQFEMGKSKQRKLYKRIVKEMAKSLSIINKIIRSEEKIAE